MTNLGAFFIQARFTKQEVNNMNKTSGLLNRLIMFTLVAFAVLISLAAITVMLGLAG